MIRGPWRLLVEAWIGAFCDPRFWRALVFAVLGGLWLRWMAEALVVCFLQFGAGYHAGHLAGEEAAWHEAQQHLNAYEEREQQLRNRIETLNPKKRRNTHERD